MLCPHTYSSALSNFLHQCSIFVTVEPILIYLNSIININVHCVSMGFHRNIMTCICHYNSIQNKQFHCLKDPLCSVLSFSHSPLNPWKILIFFLSPQLCFSQNVIQLGSYSMYVAFSDQLLSLGNMCLRFLDVFSWFDSSFLYIAE